LLKNNLYKLKSFIIIYKYKMEYNPPSETLPIFDSSVFRNRNDSLTFDEAKKYFLEWPTAQGLENLQATNIGGALVCSSTASFGTVGSAANIPICIADYSTIVPADSSNKIPTTAWVQTAITGGGSNVISIQTIISNQNITFPAGTQYATIMISGAGGASGGYYFDASVPSVTAGGGGGAGACAIIQRLPMEVGTNMICAFTAGQVNVGYLARANTVYYNTNYPLLVANAGANGTTAVSTGGNPAGGVGGTVGVTINGMGYGMGGSTGGAGQQSSGTFAILQGINFLSTVNQNMVISTITTPFNYGAGGYTRINNGSVNDVTVNNPGSAVCIVISYSS
jgi:hypothetical protein